MFFQFGSSTSFRDLGIVAEQCPLCRHVGPCAVTGRVEEVHAYFIFTLASNTSASTCTCGACGRQFPVEQRQYQGFVSPARVPRCGRYCSSPVHASRSRTTLPWRSDSRKSRPWRERLAFGYNGRMTKTQRTAFRQRDAAEFTFTCLPRADEWHPETPLRRVLERRIALC